MSVHREVTVLSKKSKANIGTDCSSFCVVPLVIDFCCSKRKSHDTCDCQTCFHNKVHRMNNGGYSYVRVRLTSVKYNLCVVLMVMKTDPHTTSDTPDTHSSLMVDKHPPEINDFNACITLRCDWIHSDLMWAPLGGPHQWKHSFSVARLAE